MLGWRNWQTRMVEVHMEQSLGVQVPLRVPFGITGAYIAQSVEHILGKDEVSGSSPDVGSIFSPDTLTDSSLINKIRNISEHKGKCPGWILWRGCVVCGGRICFNGCKTAALG